MPRNKHDDDAVEKLALLPEAELLPLLPGLAEWIRDWSWPIAPAVAKLLEQHAAALEPTILEVLAGSDEAWQEHLLHLVRPDTLPALSPQLRVAVECVAVSPMYGEHKYGKHIAEAARDLLNMYGYRSLLPSSKSDNEAVERLHQLSEAELLPLLPKLMEWLQDTNWPVSGPVWDFLEPRVAVLEPAIVEVLLGYDAAWKRNLLRLVEHATLPVLSPRLRELAERIAHSPNPGEQAEETDEAARNLLDRYATHLLPQHKGDDAAVERLRQLPEAELLPLLPELLPGLLGCLLDGNWPIAKGVGDLLAAHLHQLAPTLWEPEFLEALAGTDDIWKGNLLYLLDQAALPEFPPTVRQVIERIAHMPTPSEREYDTDEAARELLAKYA